MATEGGGGESEESYGRWWWWWDTVVWLPYSGAGVSAESEKAARVSLDERVAVALLLRRLRLQLLKSYLSIEIILKGIR